MINSNVQVGDSFAAVATDVTVEDGAVLSFDYAVNTDTVSDNLYLMMDGSVATMLTGEKSGTCCVAFPSAGEHNVVFSYVKDKTDEVFEDTVVIANVRVLYGDEAETALAAMPVYPHSLTGSELSLEIVNESARGIIIHSPDGTALGTGSTVYIVPEDTVTLHARIGDELMPELAFGYTDCDGIVHLLNECETDETGYLFTGRLSSGIAEGGASYTYCMLYGSCVTYDPMAALLVFRSEEDLNYFCQVEVGGYTWSYADGGEAATDAAAEAPTETASEPTYTIRAVDEDGNPVTGVMVNVCTDTTCSPSMVDDSGVYTFTGEAYPYVIHVLVVPEGYSFDTTQEFVMDENGGELVITLPKA